jgi:hypothetical protein
MDIKLKIIKENKDGSANAMVDFDKEGLEFLVQEGLLAVLKRYIDQDKNAQEGVKLRKKMTVSHHKNGKVTTKKISK